MKRAKIQVETGKNGYKLDADGHGYFYFTLDDLLGGMLTHVGLGITGNLSKDDIEGIMDAARRFKKEDGKLLTILRRDNAEMQEAVLSKNALIKQLQRDKDELRHLILDIMDRYPVTTRLVNGRVKPDAFNKGVCKKKKEEEETDRYGMSLRDIRGKNLVKIEPSPKRDEALSTPLTYRTTKMTNRLLSKLLVLNGQSNKRIRDIAGYTESELRSTRGFGDASFRELDIWMREHGLAVGMDLGYYDSQKKKK